MHLYSLPPSLKNLCSDYGPLIWGSALIAGIRGFQISGPYKGPIVYVDYCRICCYKAFLSYSSSTLQDTELQSKRTYITAPCPTLKKS